MSPKTIVRFLLISLTILIPFITPHLTRADTRPNIILVMSDDMGYSDIGCYGSEIKTPTLDSLAANGLRFTQFYNTGRCCPTRATLLTGLYAHQAGIGHMMNDRGYDGYRGDLNKKCVTIAQVLKPAGYSTYIAGKWHVTKHTAPDGDKSNWPLQRGFDRFYGTIHGAGSFFDPNSLVRDNTAISPYADPLYKPKTYYYTTAISDHAAKYINEHHAKTPQKPFFLYVSYTAAHWPMHALPEDIAKYKGAYDAGYAAIRKARLAKMKKLGLIDPKWKMTVQAGDWSKVKNRDWEIRCMEVYAAMVDSMDQGIGTIVKSLKQTKRLDNTLILFFQDNGGCAEGLGRTPRGKYTQRPKTPPLKPMSPSALQFDMIPKQTRDGYPVVTGPGIMPGPADTYIAYGKGWANASNTPFREYKHWVHEGGIATPLIAHWPKGIKSKNKLDHQPTHLIDLMATCVDLAKAKYPAQFKNSKIHPMEGVSLNPAFQNKSIPDRVIFWEHEGNRAARKGKYKLVAKGARGPWELYDMQADRTETNNLADKLTGKRDELIKEWNTWAKRAYVLPLNPRRSNRANKRFNKRKNFNLRPNANLDRFKAPNVEKRPFTITAKITIPDNPTGVILAQGGTAHGYSLYFHNNKLAFTLQHNSRPTTIHAPVPPKGPATIKLSLEKSGTLTLTINRNKSLTFKTPGPLNSQPLDGLQTNQDLNGPVGHYTPPYKFNGSIQKLNIKLN